MPDVKDAYGATRFGCAGTRASLLWELSPKASNSRATVNRRTNALQHIRAAGEHGTRNLSVTLLS